VIQAWGKFLKFAEPGCHCLVPCLGHEIAGALSTRIQSLDVAVETKTKDNVFVTIIVSTQYMVLKDPSRMYDAFYKLTDQRNRSGRTSSTSFGPPCRGSTWTTCSPPRRRSRWR
jgi:regulator of protease activity HflC (stomatin/prohibitin superfamily)